MKNELGNIPKVSLDGEEIKPEDKLSTQEKELVMPEEILKEKVPESKKIDNENFFTKKDKLNKTLTILLVASITIVILILLGFGLKKIIDLSKARRAEKENRNQSDRVGIGQGPGDTDIEGGTGDPIIIDDSLIGTKQGSKKRYYKGFEVVGDIRIPKTNINYPILKTMSNKSLEVSVVQEQTTTGLNNIGNTTISGHNYKNEQFFANNYKIKVGDPIYIKDEISKKELKYDVYDIKEVGENDKSFVQRNTNGATEITLSTCTDNAIHRIVIFAKHNPQTGE